MDTKTSTAFYRNPKFYKAILNFLDSEYSLLLLVPMAVVISVVLVMMITSKPVPITGPDLPLHEQYKVAKIFLTGDNSAIVLRQEPDGLLSPVTVSSFFENSLKIAPDVAAGDQDWVEIKRTRMTGWMKDMDDIPPPPGMYSTYVQQVTLHVHSVNDVNPGATPEIPGGKGHPEQQPHPLQQLP